MDQKKNCGGRDCLSSVRCSVENCVHHTIGNECTAGHITVKSEDATTKAETFCGTFAPVDTWQYV